MTKLVCNLISQLFEWMMEAINDFSKYENSFEPAEN
jgi:hypothetical protein